MMNLANVMIIFFGLSAVIAYLLAAQRHYIMLGVGNPSDGLDSSGQSKALQDLRRPVSIPIASLAVACHALSVILSFIGNGGIGGSFYEMASLTALTVMLIALPSTRSLPGLLVPLALVSAICVVLNLWLGNFKPLAGLATATSIHIALSLVAYGVLCVASIAALMLLISERRLRSGNSIGWLRQIPPLEAVETLMFRLITLGWLLLGCGLLVGLLTTDNFFAQHLAHKTVLSILSWLLFGALLVGRWRAGWRGRTAVKLTISAFLLLAVAFLGSKFVLDVVLNRI